MKDEFILSPSLLKRELPVPPVDIRVCVGRDIRDPSCRELLVNRSRKQCGAQLNSELTAYSPQEGLELIRHPDVQAYWDKVLDTALPKEVEDGVILFIPCSRNKPYTLSNQHKDLRKSFLKQGFELSENGVYINSKTDEKYYPIVISEPMGVVPYQFVMENMYPISHYDCPGFFDYSRSRGWLVTPYREDNTATDPKRSGFRLGPNEKSALEEGLRLLGVQAAKWIKNFQSQFKGAVGLLKTSAHRKILIEAQRVLEFEIYNIFDNEHKSELLDEVAKEKYVEGTTTYNRITGKTGIESYNADDLLKIAEKMNPKRGGHMSSKQWGKRAELIPIIRDDPDKIEALKREIARKSAQLLLSQKPFYPKVIISQVRERYTSFNQ